MHMHVSSQYQRTMTSTYTYSGKPILEGFNCRVSRLCGSWRLEEDSGTSCGDCSSGARRNFERISGMLDLDITELELKIIPRTEAA